MRKVCVVSGSRADYGLLRSVMTAIGRTDSLMLQAVVTGQHLVSGTDRVLVDDGFTIDARVDMDLGDDSPAGVARSMGRGLSTFGEVLARLDPDILLVPGDRYEMLAVASAALLARIPVAHVAGGDITEGAIDDSIRHAITKLSHVHFVTNEEAGRRVRQLGEDPAQVHVVGSPSLDAIRTVPRLDRDAFFSRVGLEPGPRNLIVTFHPPTVEDDTDRQCAELLAALDALDPETGILITGSNADPGGRTIDRMVQAFAARRPRSVFVESLGQALYFSALTHMNAVVGNSSSGLYEAPSFHVPTVNVGTRQDRRLKASSVIDCPAERGAIAAAIARAWTLDCSGSINPYGDGFSGERISGILAAIPDMTALIRKRFMDLPAR